MDKGSGDQQRRGGQHQRRRGQPNKPVRSSGGGGDCGSGSGGGKERGRAHFRPFLPAPNQQLPQRKQPNNREREIENIEKWLLADLDEPLPSTVHKIHDELEDYCKDVEATGEKATIEGWVEMLGGSVDPVPTATAGAAGMLGGSVDSDPTATAGAAGPKPLSRP